jgi:hypothetical protein
MNALWSTAGAMLGVMISAFVHIAISRGYMKRAVEQYDKQFEHIALEQANQDAAIKENAERLAAVKGAMDCPLPKCPMRLSLPGVGQ